MMSASAITAVVAIIVVSWAYYSESKKNYIEHNHVLGNSMLNMLTWSLNHKDIWHAYTLLRGRVHNSLKTSNHIFILFDEQQTIFASNQPAQFPTATHIADLQTVSYSLLDGLKRILGTQQASNLSIEQHMISSFPLISDDIVIGHLVIAESYNSITGMLNNISRQGLIAIFITIGFLTPIAWFWGRRIVNPLLQLDACILKIGKEPLDNIQCLVPNDKDEIGRLSQHFKIMVNDLKKKSDMEKQIVRSDRLAEQDNAIASIELVERGLTQIQETVSALLVNVNTNDKPLTRIDVEDTIKLVMPKCSTKSITINWKNDIQDTINIPSASIRQILINLLLNAIHAAGHDGHVDCLVRIENNSLLLTVKIDGD
ncbi:MAG: hypothetical protein P8Y28_08805, partial [Gammaproteobacteria bacterium]